MIIINILITGFSIIIIGYFVIFLISSNLIKKNLNKIKIKSKKLKVIIPTNGEELTISNCIRSLLKENGDIIKEIIIVIDNSDDNTLKICKSFKKKDHRIKIIEIKNGSPSKVKAILKALQKVKDEYFVLLDADTIVKKGAIEKVYSQIITNKEIMVTGIIEPYFKKGIQYNIIGWDRILRQRIFQLGRSYFGMSNFPGCFGIANTNEYKRTVSNEILEDYHLTLKALRKNKKIKVIPEVVAYEQEKTNFIKLFFQRVRWTMGNIYLIKEWIKTLKVIPLTKKIILVSYPLLWYFLFYYICILLLLIIFNYDFWILINYMSIIGLIYVVLIYSKIKSKTLKIGDLFSCIVFILIFPIIISLSLIYSLLMITFAINENIFIKRKYFRR